MYLLSAAPVLEPVLDIGNKNELIQLQYFRVPEI